MRVTSARAAAIGMAVLALSGWLCAASPGTGPEDESCIALMTPSVEGMPGNAEEVASGVRDLFAKYLTGPSIKLVVLESRLVSQASAEAKDKRCEPVLIATFKRSTSGKFSKALGQAAGNSTWFVPGGSSVGSAVARAGAVAGLQTVSSLAASTKAKDEMRLEYRLQSAAGRVQLGPNTEKQKASADGEDLVTPVVARAAEAIVTRTPAK